jgi:signal transduction histidine kinase
VAADREAITKQHDRLRAERNELNEKVESLREQRTRLAAQVSGFELELREAHDIQAQLRQQIQQLADERSELTALRDRLTGERQAMETERDQLMARVDGDRDRLQQVGEDGVGSLAKIIEDLSAQRDALERELNDALARLARLENQLEVMSVRAYAQDHDMPRLDNPQLLVSMVQELRTPMTSIIGYVDLLLGESAGILGEMQRKFLQRVSANVTRLAAMLEDLIRVTMLDSGEFALMREPVDVIGVIEDAISDTTAQLREKDLTVHLNLEEDVPDLRADPDAINQIVGQLLTNAYLASPPGSEIFVTARRQRMDIGNSQPVDSLYVSVEDRGGGIAEEDRVRVFSRKYKAENPLIKGLGDTGVGLSIAKALVEAHGGRIWLDTQEQVGSSVSFALPMDAALEAEGHR